MSKQEILNFMERIAGDGYGGRADFEIALSAARESITHREAGMSEKTNDDLSFDVKVAIQRAVLFHPLFEGTAAEALEIAIAAIKAGDEICASSPAQEPVTAEPVAWRWKVHGIWHYAGGFPVSGAEPLYAIPAPPQPGREWLPINGMEWPAMPVMLGFWYQGAFKQYIAEHDPAGWMEQGKRTFYPSHMQGWFTHWQPLSAPPAGEPE